MESLFYIGQKVVAINDYDNPSIFKKGDEFEILDIIQGCHSVLVKIFIGRFIVSTITCSTCGSKLTIDGDPYFNQHRFAPMQEISNMTYEEALEYVSVKEYQHI